MIMPTSLLEDFDNRSGYSALWEKVVGAEVSNKCGTLVEGDSLWFGLKGPRLLVTAELNTLPARY